MNMISQIKEDLTRLCSLPGLSSFETPIAETTRDLWKDLTDEITVSNLGNLYGVKHANVPSADGKQRKVLMAAHMDAVGMIVTELVGEFIRFEQMGGLDPRILPGLFVNVHTRHGVIKGLVVMPSQSLTKTEHGRDPIPLNELLIDTGYGQEELKKLVRPGDIISYANDPVALQDDTFAAHTLDNRASVAALTVCLRELQNIRHKWDLYTVGTVQEEESMVGAMNAVYDIRPDIAIAVDVTFATGPGSKEWFTRPLASGPSLGFGMNIHPPLYKKFKEICEAERIPYTTEYSHRMTGTDACEMQVATGGTPTIVISIPLRYMHTANEVVSLKDINDVGKLLALFVKSLDEQTIEQIQWED